MGLVVIIELYVMIVVEDGWQVEINVKDYVILKWVVLLKCVDVIGIYVDLVMLEVFNNLFMFIVEQMGVIFQNIVYLVNIKECLDFFCVVFDVGGVFVVNVLYMLVYLGFMDWFVEMVIKLNEGQIKLGDVFVLNVFYNGGMYLLDIIVVFLVFDDVGERILFWVVFCGYYVDVGGFVFGFMILFVIKVDEEGVLFDNFKLVDQGCFCEMEFVELFINYVYLVCNLYQNVVDFLVQVVVNEKGIQEFCKMVVYFGFDVVQVYMGYVQDNVEESVCWVIEVLKDLEYEYLIDQGLIIKVKIMVDKDKCEVIVDFIGIFSVKLNNFNVLELVIWVVIFYCFWVMVDGDILMNVGCLKLINIIILDDCMLCLFYLVVVVVGNVEMLQYVINVVFVVLGVMVNSQGLMNNLIFGNDIYQYYEIICLGFLVGFGFKGIDGVYVYMINFWLIDFEVLEFCFLVLFEDFYICKGFGGKGKWFVGDGIFRRLCFLEKMDCVIFGFYCMIVFKGMVGGEDGEFGCIEVWWLFGEVEQFKGCDQIILEVGEVVIVIMLMVGGWGILQVVFLVIVKIIMLFQMGGIFILR